MPRKPDRSRRSTLWGLVVIALIIAAFTAYFWPDDPDKENLPTALSAIVDDLVSDSPHRRSTARQDAWTLLVDPVRSTLGIRMSRVERIVPAEWFRDRGAPIVTDALLRHFREGWEEDEAHELLVALIDMYPNACRRVTLDPIRGSLDSTMVDTPIDGVAIAREIAAVTPLGCYLSYRLDVTDTPIQPLIAASLLTAYRRPAPTALRLHWIRLLRRVSDHDLRPLALLNRGPDRWVDPEWVSLARDRGLDYRDMDDWCERGDHDAARRELITTLLGSGDSAQRARGLDRFRWDPVADLDDQVLQLAVSGELGDRRVALAALPGIPTERAGTVITEALDDPNLRDVALNAARALSGASFGFLDGGWNVGLTPVAHLEALDAWRDLIDRVAPVSPFAESQRSDLEFRAYVQLLAPRVRRGDLSKNIVSSTIPSLAAHGLSPTTPAPIRAATWATVARWEQPPVDVLVRAILGETNATIRTSLVDALLVSGHEGIGPALDEALDAITKSQQFDGIELTRAYSVAFPTIRLLESLLPALTSSESRRRAAGAYLAGGLTVPRADEQRGKLLILAELLDDDAEGTRYWAHASLRALFGGDFGYDARRSKDANLEAVRKWRTRVTEGSRKE